MIGFAVANPFTDYILPNSQWVGMLGMTNILLLIGIPILGLIRSTFRFLNRRKKYTKSWATPLIILWVINAFSLASLGGKVFREFKMSHTLTENVDLQVTGDQLELKAIGPVYNPHEEFPLFEFFQFDDDKMICNFMRLDIEQSETENFELVQRNYARGNTISEAKNLAVELPVSTSMDGNILKIDPSFSIPKGSKFRAQNIKLTLKVPKGKSIKISKDLSRMLHHINLKDHHVSPRRWHNETWTMEEDGLACSDCDGHAKEDNNEFSFSDFSKINIDGLMKVNIEKGDQYNVRITGREVYTKKVELEQMGETLHISTELKRTSSPIRVYVTMPQLASINVENTDDVRINGFEEKSMSIYNTGNFDIKAYVNVDTLTIKQEGRNELDIRGNGKFIKADLIGRAKLEAERFSVNNAIVDLRIGSHASAKMSVIDTLSRKGDHSRIRFDGDPVVIDY